MSTCVAEGINARLDQDHSMWIYERSSTIVCWPTSVEWCPFLWSATLAALPLRAAAPPGVFQAPSRVQPLDRWYRQTTEPRGAIALLAGFAHPYPGRPL